MASTVYFGNTERFVPIPAPLTAADASHTGFSSVIQLLNGGAIVEDSLAQHREWSWSWIGDPANLNIVKQFLQGTYGPGPYYWIDPFASDVNLFAPNWAAPRLTQTDWKEIHDVAHSSLTPTPANAYGHPAQSAVYNLATVAANYVPYRRFTIMIPPTQTLYIGASGSATLTGVVAVRPVLAATGAYDTVVNTAPLPVTGSTRFFGTTFSGATYSRVEVFLTKTAADASTITLTSMVAVLSLTGAIPLLTGPFLGGEGSTGLRFVGGLKETLYTAGGLNQPRRKGYSIRLVETEAWEL